MSYNQTEETIWRRIHEVLQLLNVMDRDHRFEQKQNDAAKSREEAKTMSEWLSRVIDESEAKGRAEGEAKGEAKGETKGTIRTLWSLVNDHLIDIDVASARVHMSVSEFEQKAKALMAEEPVEYNP